MPLRHLRHCLIILTLLAFQSLVRASAELNSGQAALLGALMILAPILFVAGLVLIAALVFAPTIIRAVRPASTKRVKWLVVVMLTSLELLWVYLRGGQFLSQVFKAHFAPDLRDGLLVTAWGLLVFSLLKHRPERQSARAP